MNSSSETASKAGSTQADAGARRIAVVGIVVTERLKSAPKVNQVLSDYAHIIIGRMGIPYRDRCVSVIALIVDGDTDNLGAMTGKLGSIPGVKVRTAITV
ncbi:MAG TPA: CopG family transcriptional regulator [Firmicutes bacterium]|nr:CopG family transcriptional regulator [Bacillota bacterium]